MPPRRPKRRRAEEHANHERWLISYADFMTLMFAFFTALYAISTVDAKKLNSMVESLQEAFEPGSASAQSRILVGNKQAPALSKNAGPGGEVGLADLEARLSAQLADAVAEKRIDIELDGRGLVISVREAGSFPAGSSDLSDAAHALLRELGSVLTEIDNLVRIEGHTDDVPIHTARFASNWELSTARATNVIAFLLTDPTLRPDHFSAAGYAQYHPRAPNESDANRIRNRRVDIVILSPGANAAAQPGTGAGAAAPPDPGASAAAQPVTGTSATPH
jgi:chemotaxis protein MotB